MPERGEDVRHVLMLLYYSPIVDVFKYEERLECAVAVVHV
jgi:hypothetical protein